MLGVSSYIPDYFYLNFRKSKNKELKIKLQYFSQTNGIFVNKGFFIFVYCMYSWLYAFIAHIK